MQTVSEAYATLLKSNRFVFNQAAIVQMVVDGYEITKARSFSMSREYGAIAQQCVIEIPNVNFADPDPSDTGYYNQQRDAPDFNKPPNAYFGIIQPGKEFYIRAGYGTDNVTDTVKVFTGVIDTVEIGIDGQGKSILKIVGRGSSGKLVDRKVKHTISGINYYWINYPIESGWDVFYLTSANTNPYLGEIWSDVCQRGGYSSGDLNIATDYVTGSALRVDDLDPDTFQRMTGSWADIAVKIAEILNAYMYENEDGELNLIVPDDIAYEGTGNITFSGTSWQSLSSFQGGSNYRCIEDSLVIDSYTLSDGEFEFDYPGNKVRRVSGSAIPDGSPVSIVYTYCAWEYKTNQTYDLNQWVSHDDVYGMLAASNNENELYRSLTLGTLGDGSTVSTDKVLETNIPELITNTQLDTWLANKKSDMKKNYFNLEVDVVGIPHLRVRDLFCVLLYGTVTSIYEITGFNLSYDPENGIQQQIKGIYYALSNLVNTSQSYLRDSDIKYLKDSDGKFLIEP